MKRLAFALLFLFMFALTGVAIWGILHLKEKPKERERPPLVLRLRVTKVVPQRAEEVVEVLGNVVPRKRARVVSEVQGVIVYRSPRLEAGNFVSPKEVLVKVSPRHFLWSMEKAKAALEQTEVLLKKLKAEEEKLESLREIYQDNLALSKEQEKEAALLYKKQAATKYEWDNYRRLVREDLARLVNTEHALRLIAFRRQELEKLLEVRRREFWIARRLYEKCLVRPPFAGWITRRAAEVGEGTAPGKFFFEIISQERLAVFDLSPRYLPRLKQGMKVFLTSPALPGRWEGVIERIHPELDRATRRVTLYVKVPNRSPLLAGMFVKGQVLLKTHPRAIVIPRELLRSDGRVCLLREGKIQAVPVQVSAWMSQEVILSQGVREGDWLILDPVDDSWIGLRAKGVPVTPSSP